MTDRGESEGVYNYILDFCFLDSLSSINCPHWVITVGSSADQQGSIALHEAKGEPLEEVLGGLSLLLASVPSQGSGQHLDLPDGHPVHPPKRLPGKGQEGDQYSFQDSFTDILGGSCTQPCSSFR